jgi:hypothetical protein
MNPPEHPWDRIFLAQTASEPLALQILGLDSAPDRQTVFSAYRARLFSAHPDRGGTDQEGAHILAAWTWLRVHKDW